MNGIEIYKLIEEIASTKSAVTKRALLEKHKDDEVLKKVLDYALNPFKRYGIATTTMPLIPGARPPGWEPVAVFDSPQIWKMLDDMISGALSGSMAIEMVETTFKELDTSEAVLLQKIILKDLRCGVTAKSVNKVIPGLIPNFECMLAHKFDEVRVKKWPWLIEPKLDGFRVLAFVDFIDQTVKFFSRTGHEYTCFEHLKFPILDKFAIPKFGDRDEVHIFASIASLNTSVVLDGEMVSGDFAKTSSELRKKDEQAKDAKFSIFDIVPRALFDGAEKEDKQLVDYKTRRHILGAYLNSDAGESIHMLDGYWVNSVKEIKRYYVSFREAGFEGAIVKNPKARYQRKRSYDWMKLKNEETHDVVVVGYYSGEVGTKYEKSLGGLICNFMGVRVDVGGGFTDAQRDEFYKVMQRDEGRRDNDENPEYELLNTVIEVEAHEVTPDGSLRHPRFVRLRKNDKTIELDEEADE